MTKKYNEIEIKDNMKVESEEPVVAEVSERPELTKVVAVQPKKIKKGLFNRLITGIVGPDGIPGIGAYVNEEIIKPAVKNIIVDAVTSGINMIMYGEKGGSSRGRGSNYGRRESHRPTINYSDRYQNSQSEPRERIVSRAKLDFDEYVMEDRHEASNVLVSLCENAERYGNVSIADYYDLIGVTPKFTDNNHGWDYDTISRATVIPVRGGYMIKFPPVGVL